MYLDCIKQKYFRDCLVRIRLGISNLKVHKNRYARSDVLLDNDCQICPGYAGQRTTLVPCVQEIQEDKTEHAEKY